jgi:vitamin K-dependent gamma-carboxylase-like protein
LAFHLVNSRIFSINIFPWLMIGGTALFFPPDWPRQLINDARANPRPRRFWRFVVGFVVVGALASYIPITYSIVHTVVGGLGGGLIGYFIDEPWRRERTTAAVATAPDSLGRVDAPPSQSRKRLVLWLLGLWVAFQVLFPLRHFLIPGNVYWTEEAQRFSWHMMLKNKIGETKFLVRDPRTGKTVEVDPADSLSDRQLGKMTGSPDLTVQFAHYLSDRARKDLHIANAEVRVRTSISLNLRPEQVFIDPTVDLARVKRPWLGHKKWILPLERRSPHGPQGTEILNKDAGESSG